MILADFKTHLPKHLPRARCWQLKHTFDESVSRRLLFLQMFIHPPYLTNAKEIRGLAESRSDTRLHWT